MTVVAFNLFTATSMQNKGMGDSRGISLLLNSLTEIKRRHLGSFKIQIP